MAALEADRRQELAPRYRIWSPTGSATPRQIAIAAAHEFGVPLLDLDAVDLDLDVVKLVDEKLLTKHRILPLLQRGKRLFVAVCDPTNLQALDDIKFQTTLRSSPSSSKRTSSSARRTRDRGGRHADVEPRTTRATSTSRTSKSRRRRGRRRRGVSARRRRRRADRALRQQGDARRDQARRVGHPLRAVREDLSHSSAPGRRAERDRAAAGRSWR